MASRSSSPRWRPIALGSLGLALSCAAGLWWSTRPPAQPAPSATELPLEPEMPARTVVAPPQPAGELVDEPLSAAPAPGSPWAALNARAIAALDARDFALAIELLEQCVAGVPDEPVFKGNLAEALARRAVDEHERTRPCEACLEWLERAIELAPEREALRQLLERWRAELAAEREFQRDRSVHFELSYDGWRGVLLDAAPDVLDELERHYIELALIFGLHPAERGRPRIPVVLYRREEFTSITGLADWAGGSYDGTIRVPMQEGRALDAELSVLLRHELIHAFVRESGGGSVPAWLNEGLAQWFHSSAAADVARARRAISQHGWIDLGRLQRAFAALGEPAEIAAAYAQSLALVEYLERAHGRDALLRMVAACGEGGAPAAAFEAWTRLPFATALDDFLADLQR